MTEVHRTCGTLCIGRAFCSERSVSSRSTRTRGRPNDFFQTVNICTHAYIRDTDCRLNHLILDFKSAVTGPSEISTKTRKNAMAASFSRFRYKCKLADALEV